MKTLALIGLVALVAGGCAREARPAESASLAPANEERCMALAEHAYAKAAGHEMSSFGDAPVPDAAYEDTYAACTEEQ